MPTLKWQLLISVILLTSCTADVHLVLTEEKAATLDATIQFNPIFLRYYRDLANITGDQLAPEEVIKTFSPYADIQATRSEDWKTLSIRIQTKDINELIAHLRLPASLDHSEKDIHFFVYPDRSLTPSEKLQNISILSLFIYPKDNYQDYLDDISWALEEYASIQETTDMANSTYTDLYMSALGYTPQSHNGVLSSANTVHFHLSLADIVERGKPYTVTLSKPVAKKE